MTRAATAARVNRCKALAIVLAAMLSGAGIVSALKLSKCSEERDREMDVCASKLGFLGDHSFQAPKSINDTAAYCATLKDSLACLQNYARDCIQGITKQVMTSILRRGRQQHSQICQSDQQKRDFIRKMSCLQNNNIEQYHACMDGSIARFEYISSKVPVDSRFVSLCCSYLIFDRDLTATLNRICPVKAPQAATAANASNKSDRDVSREFISKIVQTTAGEYYAMFCDSFQSIEDCKQSPKTSGPLKGLEDVTTKVYQGKLKPKGKSLVPILLDIIGGGGSSPPTASVRIQ